MAIYANWMAGSTIEDPSNLKVYARHGLDRYGQLSGQLQIKDFPTTEAHKLILAAKARTGWIEEIEPAQVFETAP